VGIVCKGFATSTRLVARAEGLAHIRMVEGPPPNIAVLNPDELHEYAGRILDEVIAALISSPDGAVLESGRSATGRPEGIVFRGDLDAVNEHFRANVWCDGLPIIPPTVRNVEAMLRFTDRGRDEVIGILAPRRLPPSGRSPSTA